MDYFYMQNVWKIIIVLMISATVEAGGVEPVLMTMDGSAIEDKMHFHLVHKFVRQWQYNLLYELGEKPEDAGAALNDLLEPHGVKAMMVPTSLWQIFFCELNIMSPEFERIKKYIHGRSVTGDTTEVEIEDSRSRKLWNYGSNRFSHLDTDIQVYESIHEDTKHPRMSCLKQMVDNHILANYRNADKPNEWEGIIKRFVDNYFNRIRESPDDSDEQKVFREDPTLKLPTFVGVGGKSFSILREGGYMKTILQKELDSLTYKTLILMRATDPITLKVNGESYRLQDSPVILNPIGVEGSSATLKTDCMNSISFSNSYLGGIGSDDTGANVHEYWSKGRTINILELPGGLSSEIRDIFWVPPFFGPLGMIIAGEFHPRLKIRPDVDSGACVISNSIHDQKGFAKKALFHTTYSLGKLASVYHLIVANCSTMIPPHNSTDSVDTEFYRAENQRFSVAIASLLGSQSTENSTSVTSGSGVCCTVS